MSDKEIYREIKQAIASGDIAALPKEKLVQFQSALAQSHARLHLGAPQFPQICSTVELHLAARLQEQASQDHSNNHGDEKWYKKPIGIIGIGLTTAILAMLVKWRFGF